MIKPLFSVLLFVVMVLTGFRCAKNVSDSPGERIDIKIKEVVGYTDIDYDCNGVEVTIPQNDIIAFDQNTQRGTPIYSNVPL
ncbi:MAG: hypothetical protein M9933_07520 [Chitinophagaceae bacterium]|nr:hypothetical protein [Chitinophagaceae bacterium]